jgi:hypothetical protein
VRLVSLILLVPLAWTIVFGAVGWAFPQEEESAIKTDDCRKIRYLDARPALDVFKTYSCTYQRSEIDGHITSGYCTWIQEPVFGVGCEDAKVYVVHERKATAKAPPK